MDMPAKKKVCIVGGGATGVALLWALSQDPQAGQEWDVTLIHNQSTVGGHSLTYPVTQNGKIFPVDIGVQFISPMLYPNVHIMLQQPEFQSRVPITDYPALKIACAFPPNGSTSWNWGNFSDYQQGSDFVLYSADVMADIQTFQDFIEISLVAGWGKKTLQEYFDLNSASYKNPDLFINYILSPYLSIINGYGAALLDQTIFLDVFPLFSKLPLPQSWGFPTPLGSFSNPGVGWQRFTNGAQSWVQAMLAVAQTHLPPNLLLNSNVTAVWTDESTNQVTVQWTDQNNKQNSGVFDKVVLTTDMWTNSSILNNPNNQGFWNNLYIKYIGYGRDKNMNPLGNPVIWDLMWGMCYIHSDPSILSPDLTQQEETLQFNAYYATGNQNGNYDLANTFTTYIQKNVFEDPDASNLYLTMYGYIPNPANGDRVPGNVLFQEAWTHGRWVPSAMDGPKTNLYLAQGKGNSFSYPGQLDTNIYFAGNNTTFDSEEGALISAMAIADYAFGVNYPLAELSGDSLFAFLMYTIYHNVMFPKQNTAHAAASIYQLLPDKDKLGVTASPLLASSQVKIAATPKKSSTVRKKKTAAKKAASASRPKKTRAATTKKGASKKAKASKAVKKPTRKQATLTKRKATRKKAGKK